MALCDFDNFINEQSYSRQTSAAVNNYIYYFKLILKIKLCYKIIKPQWKSIYYDIGH